jgi:hypothetical protein
MDDAVNVAFTWPLKPIWHTTPAVGVTAAIVVVPGTQSTPAAASTAFRPRHI